jgi:hypothetical protein
VAALLPDIPHPILALTKERGPPNTARLVEVPHRSSPAPLRPPVRSWARPRRRRGSCPRQRVVDPPWFSDTLCKAVTSDSIVERALFATTSA